MTGDNTFVGRVICRLENEEFRRNGDLPILGTFTFNGNGKTDLVSQDHSDDDVTMDDYAVLIVLHYLKLALKYDPPK